MSFGAQLTQLIVVIVTLVVAYAGVTFWTKHKAQRGGASDAGGGGGWRSG